MTAGSQAQEEAVAVLLDAGWSVERIREALGITEILAHKLVRHVRPPLAGAGCCHREAPGRYCDAPVRWPGSVYCDRHHVITWPLRA